MKRKAAWTLFASMVFCCAPVSAQTPSPLPEWTYSAGVLMSSSMEPDIPEWSALGGVSAEYGPRYDGARDYHVMAGPTIEVRYRDLAFFSTGEGLGINLLRGRNYRAGASLVYDLGRRAENSDATRGLGNVDIAPELKAYVEALIFPVMLRADVRRGLGGHDGWIGDLGAYMPVYGKDKFFVFVGPSVTLADDRYMAHFFGVTPAQSAASGYTVYHAHAGLKSVNLGSSVTWLVTDHWLVNILTGGQCLLGDAADSPLTLQRNQYATSLTLGYQF